MNLSYKAEFIFPSSKDPNLDLFKVYIWLLKQDISTLILANKASKVIPREGIKKLEDILREKKNFPISPEAREVIGKTFPYNPNFLVKKSLDTWIPPLFIKKPPWHKIGDRVVNLKNTGFSFAPFGASGTVVGILGNKPENGSLEVKIEVLFDIPFIGGTNLGGRCQWARGAVVDFDDIYNLNSWGQCVKARDRRERNYYEGWDGKFGRGYVPVFQTSSEASEQSDEDTAKKVNPINDSNRFDIITKELTQFLEVQAKNTQAQGNQKAELPQGLKHIVQQQAQTNLQSQPQNTTPLTTTVPKTLAIRKKDNQEPKESSDEPKKTEKKQGPKKEKKVVNVSDLEGSDASRSTQTSQDSKSSFDFSSFINSNLPKTGQETTLPNTNYSFDNQSASEDMIKKALNLKPADKNEKPKKPSKLQMNAKEFTVVTREQKEPVTGPVDFKELEKMLQQPETKSSSIFNDPAIISMNIPQQTITIPSDKIISAEELEKQTKSNVPVIDVADLEKVLSTNSQTGANQETNQNPSN